MTSKLQTFRNKTRLTIEDALSKLSDEKLTGNFDDVFLSMPVTSETSCGFGLFRSPHLQR